MPRLAAFELLLGGERGAPPLRRVPQVAREHELDARDRGLLRRLVGTEVRRRGSLRAIVRAYARGKPSRELALHLHIALVQALFLDRVPDHAAVAATLEAVQRTLGQSKVPYVNAVLRTILRERRAGHAGDPRRDLIGRDLHLERAVFRDPREHPYLWAEDALSLPAALAKRWAERHGEERMQSLARAALDEPWLSLRAGAGTARGDLAARLVEAGAHPVDGEHPALLLLPPGEEELALSGADFAAGRATVQGQAALVAAELVGAREGERVLDLCAAPGGKTAVLAEAGARVLACDVEAERLDRLRATLERLGLAERVEIARVDPERGPDASDFDAVLVDAPCSNTGVLAQRPEARWRHGPRARRELVELQRALLALGAARTRSGGRLVWSTCSLEPEENAQLVRSFLEDTPGWELEEARETLPGPAERGGPIDGGYAARLRRTS